MEKYCYWSFASNSEERNSWKECVMSARHVGTPHDFHLLTDVAVPHLSCFDAMQVADDNGFRILAYLKAAISKLNYDMYIYLTPETRFTSRPLKVLSHCKGKPLSVAFTGPVETCASLALSQVYSIERDKAIELLRSAGVFGQPWFCRFSPFAVKRKAVDLIFDLCREFRVKSKEHGYEVNAALAICFAANMLIPDRMVSPRWNAFQLPAKEAQCSPPTLECKV
jgi:hypothetical protein